MLKHLATLAFLAGIPAAQAGDIRPLAAQHVSLGTIEGVAYFSREPDGFRVVTTLTDPGHRKPFRLVATLTDGQSIQLSVPRGVDEPAEAIELVRHGNALVLQTPVTPLTASID